MNSGRLVIGTIVGMFVVAAGGWWIETATAVPSSYGVYGPTTTTISDTAGDGTAGDGMLRDMKRRGFIVDRYGNPIEEAIGDYRVDPRGDIFERHSPTTAVPRLPDPSV
jgi:hypothetical protein